MPPRRAVLRPLALLLVTACASGRSAAPTGGESQNTVRVVNGAGAGSATLTTTSSYQALVDALPASADRVWALMPAVYQELGIDFTTVDQATRVIGNDELKLRQRIGREPLSRFVSCGSENGRENADSYEVTMRVRTQVVPADSASSRVVTAVSATARSRLFSSGDVACSSTQRLESRIAEVTKEKAGA
jgi:hypothetical protein